MQSLHTRNSWSQTIQLRESVLYKYDLKSHSIASKKRTMQPLHTRSCRAKTRSRRTKTRSRTEDIWSFCILIDLILWQNLVRSEKLESALFASIHVFHIDFSIVSSFAHLVGISYGLRTAKLHRYRPIDVARSTWEPWDPQWCYQIMMWSALSSISHYSDNWYLLHDVSCYSILDTRSHIDVSPHGNAYSERRNSSDARSHALQFDLTSYLKPTDSSNLDSFVSAVFASVYDLTLQNLRHRESLFESFKQYIAERATSLRKL